MNHAVNNLHLFTIIQQLFQLSRFSVDWLFNIQEKFLVDYCQEELRPSGSASATSVTQVTRGQRNQQCCRRRQQVSHQLLIPLELHTSMLASSEGVYSGNLPVPSLSFTASLCCSSGSHVCCQLDSLTAEVRLGDVHSSFSPTTSPQPEGSWGNSQCRPKSTAETI